MSKFDEYSKKYDNIKMERRDGILQMTLQKKAMEEGIQCFVAMEALATLDHYGNYQ